MQSRSQTVRKEARVTSNSSQHDYRIISYPHRVYSGKDALRHLPSEARRHGASRIFLICGRSVARKTDLIARIGSLLGPSLAGVFDHMSKDTALEDALAARDAALAAGADMLVAIGAGSVIQGARVVAILMAEQGPVDSLATQYPNDGGPAISPKLPAPKVPIINVLTAGTTAQNRAGSPAKMPGLDHRLEFFDPKTRPVALFWDEDALATAPASMVRASYAAILWRAVMNMEFTAAPPLVEHNRRQVFETILGALPRVQEAGTQLRHDLCLATYLQNLDADHGGIPAQSWVARLVYAFAASLFNLHEQVSQGEAHCAFTPMVMRKFGPRNPQEMCRIATALGVWREGDAVADAPSRAADRLEMIFTSIGMPIRVSQIGIPVSAAEQVFKNSLKNYNADPKRTFHTEPELVREALIASW